MNLFTPDVFKKSIPCLAAALLLSVVFTGVSSGGTLIDSMHRTTRPGVSGDLPATADDTVADQDQEPERCPFKRLIATIYQKLLGRKPDPGGWDHYLRKIKEEGWDLDRVKEALLSSREYARKNNNDEDGKKRTGTGSVNATIGLNVRTGPGVGNTKIGCLSHGSKVVILEEKDGWYKISYQGGEAWVCARYITPEAGSGAGGGTGDAKTGGDDGAKTGRGSKGPANAKARGALAWAEAQMNPATATGVNRNNGKSVQSDPTAWNYWCLAFVATAYGRSVPNLSAGSAIQSYYKFKNAGQIETDGPIPAGAPVFWDKTSSNKYGHIAIASGRTTPDGDPIIITSGWRGRNGITEMPLSQLTACCGRYLGYGVIP